VIEAARDALESGFVVPLCFADLLVFAAIRHVHGSVAVGGEENCGSAETRFVNESTGFFGVV